MGEYKVSIEGVTYPLPRPFMVIATQVGFGGEGTYPLSDVQEDRFLLKAVSRYPDREEERQVVSKIDYLDEAPLSQVAEGPQIEEIQKVAKQVYISEAITEYILDIVDAVRRDPDVARGPSPRGSIALYKCSRALALLEGRDYVIPDDIKRFSLLALGHRIRVKAEAEMEGIGPELVVERALSTIPVPKVEA
jgi:MoxR-like ATPase